MNSDSLGKTRTQVIKKHKLLFVFALVALAFVVTPLAVFAACPQDAAGGNNGNGNNGNGNNGNGNGGVSAIGAGGVVATAANTLRRNRTNINPTNLKQIIDGLETSTLQFTNSAGNVVNFGKLRAGQVFEIIASDTTNNTVRNVQAKLIGKTLALVTLPANIQQQIIFANVKSPCLSSKTFQINIAGSATLQTAQCLDSNSASVTIPDSGIPTTIVFPQSPAI